MKKLSTIIIFTILFILPTINNTNSKEKDILYYYNAIPLNFLNDRKYEISYKNNKYITQSVANYEIETTVDFKNAYLSVYDTGTGGGVIIHELAIFIDSKNIKYLAVNIVDGNFLSKSGKCNFYLIKDNKFINVTDKIMPVIPLSTFLKKPNEYVYLFNHFQQPFYSIIYSLPRIGTTIEAEIYYGQLNYIINHSNADSELVYHSKDFIENIKNTKIYLLWDIKKGSFNIKNN